MNYKITMQEEVGAVKKSTIVETEDVTLVRDLLKDDLPEIENIFPNNYNSNLTFASHVNWRQKEHEDEVRRNPTHQLNQGSF